MENLFSYGTLQLEQVQINTFGRLLQGQEDALAGFKLLMIKIEDESVIASSGLAEHPMLVYSGNIEDRVSGTVFSITEKELYEADEYEVDAYKRVAVKLQSGKEAWVYLSAATNIPQL